MHMTKSTINLLVDAFNVAVCIVIDDCDIFDTDGEQDDRTIIESKGRKATCQ